MEATFPQEGSLLSFAPNEGKENMVLQARFQRIGGPPYCRLTKKLPELYLPPNLLNTSTINGQGIPLPHRCITVCFQIKRDMSSSSHLSMEATFPPSSPALGPRKAFLYPCMNFTCVGEETTTFPLMRPVALRSALAWWAYSYHYQKPPGWTLVPKFNYFPIDLLHNGKKKSSRNTRAVSLDSFYTSIPQDVPSQSHPQLPSAPQCLKEADGKDPRGIRGFHQAAPLISEASLAIITGETWIHVGQWQETWKKRPSSYLLPPGAGTLSLLKVPRIPRWIPKYGSSTPMAP